MNDGERRDLVANDEGLYDLQQSSRQSEQVWVRNNRELIDEVAGVIESGEKRQHYLKYGA